MMVFRFVKRIIKSYFKAYTDAMEPFYRNGISPMCPV